MNQNKVIAIILLVAAALLYVSSNSEAKNTVDQYLGKNDKLVSCKVDFDYDSVIGAQCGVVDTCRTGFTTLFLGIGEEDSVVRLLYAGRSYASQTITTTFGYNEQTTLQACVPGSAASVDIQVLRENGAIADTRSATLQ